VFGLGDVCGFDLVVENDKLLTEKSIFSNQFGIVSAEVGACGARNRVSCGLSDMEESLFQIHEKTDDEMEEQLENRSNVV
jgi:hypothetical protein